MGYRSAPDILTLHAVRILGMADARAVAGRFGIDAGTAAELLLDFEATGWVRHSEFAGHGGWSLTDAGRVENERLLATELDDTGARPVVDAAHLEFVKLNARLLTAVTNWQTRPVPGDPMAVNDHTDFRWDDRVLDTLERLDRQLRPLSRRLVEALDRFTGYDDRFSRALERVGAGERSWVDQTGIDSCHTVWFQLHEDLLATLNLDRARQA